jgi:SAM-dependent methyltransferase
VKQRVLRLLENPMVKGLRDDDPRAFEIHRAVIEKKRLLAGAYARFYGEFVAAARRVPPGPCVELGSGGGVLKRYLPRGITSDVVPVPYVDLVFSGEAMPFADETVAAVFLLDVFHHVKRPEAFLREVERCLVPGGRLLMVEPALTPWGRFVRRNFHHERLDEHAGWDLEGRGGWRESNLALPWIVFVRDRARLERVVPRLRLVRYEPHTPFRFLLSGGVSYRSLVPGAFAPLVTFAERLATPLNPLLGMHVTIELAKTDGRGAGESR